MKSHLMRTPDGIATAIRLFNGVPQSVGVRVMTAKPQRRVGKRKVSYEASYDERGNVLITEWITLKTLKDRAKAGRYNKAQVDRIAADAQRAKERG